MRSIAQEAHAIIVPEMNLGEILYEVQRSVKDTARVVPLDKIGEGEMITPDISTKSESALASLQAP